MALKLNRLCAVDNILATGLDTNVLILLGHGSLIHSFVILSFLRGNIARIRLLSPNVRVLGLLWLGLRLLGLQQVSGDRVIGEGVEAGVFSTCEESDGELDMA
jgi:hypothetical protein